MQGVQIANPSLIWRELGHYGPAVRGLICSNAEKRSSSRLLGFGGQKTHYPEWFSKTNKSLANVKKGDVTAGALVLMTHTLSKLSYKVVFNMLKTAPSVWGWHFNLASIKMYTALNCDEFLFVTDADVICIFLHAFVSLSSFENWDNP